jgi:hypothetical protein
MALRLVKVVPPVQSVATEVPKITVPSVEVSVATGVVDGLVQEYLILYQKLHAIDGKDIVKRMEQIRKQLQQVAHDLVEDSKPAVFSCALGEIEFDERGEKTEIPDPRSLVAFLEQKFGVAVAWSVVSIAITPLRAILSEAELAKVSTKVPGSRSIKNVVLK